jgi:penicillin-insensitive murein DD-endopeptidase
MSKAPLVFVCALSALAICLAPAAAYNGRDSGVSSEAQEAADPAAGAVPGTVAGTVRPRARVPAPEPIPARAQFGFVLTERGAAHPVGSYARGCLADAVPLAPTGHGWQIMRPARNRNWGHPLLVNYITKFANAMRDREGWPGLLVGDMSQPRGGPMLTGHASHQTGLDVDVWFKPMPAKELTANERETLAPSFLADNDGATVLADRWHEGWVRLLRRAASYPEVARIFVHPTIKRALCDAPQTDRRWMTKVRAYYLHNDHFHVRLRCPAGSTSCTPQADPSPDDGCGKELDGWMRRVAKRVAPAVAKAEPPVGLATVGADHPGPTPAAPVIAKPAVSPALPPKPPLVPAVLLKAPAKRIVTLADLPPDCSAVLADGKPALLGRIAPSAADVLMPTPSPARVDLAQSR